MGVYIDAGDLLTVVKQSTIDRYFDDDGDGHADPDIVALQCLAASNWVETKLLKGWPLESIRELLKDPEAMRHLAWAVIHFGASRVTEWRDAEGRAPFWLEFSRGEKFFAELSKGEARSAHESTAGTHPIIGGRQIMPPSNMPTYVFAPDPNRGNPGGSGGY